jgi:hypothetical protein
MRVFKKLAAVIDLHATILNAAGIPPDLAYEVDRRPVYVTNDGNGTVRELFASASPMRRRHSARSVLRLLMIGQNRDRAKALELYFQAQLQNSRWIDGRCNPAEGSVADGRVGQAELRCVEKVEKLGPE